MNGKNETFKAYASFSDKIRAGSFRIYGTMLSRQQRQFSGEYHDDIFLRNRILRANDTSRIAQSMKERSPDTSDEATNFIATFYPREQSRHAHT